MDLSIFDESDEFDEVWGILWGVIVVGGFGAFTSSASTFAYAPLLGLALFAPFGAAIGYAVGTYLGSKGWSFLLGAILLIVSPLLAIGALNPAVFGQSSFVWDAPGTFAEAVLGAWVPEAAVCAALGVAEIVGAIYGSSAGGVIGTGLGFSLGAWLGFEARTVSGTCTPSPCPGSIVLTASVWAFGLVGALIGDNAGTLVGKALACWQGRRQHVPQTPIN